MAEGIEVIGPFGNPDGSREDLALLLKRFVSFDVPSGGAGPASAISGDSSARVLVGRLGAGKTMYLRRMQSYKDADASVYADVPQQSLPATELIVRACQWFPEHLLDEKWMTIWHRAILRSLATHLMRHKDLAPYLGRECIERLSREYGRLIGTAKQPRSIYSQLRAIIDEANTANHLTRYLNDDGWDDLEYELAEILKTTPPVYFYLDAVDE